MTSPTVRQRRLARELRQLRDHTGLTIEQVAEKLALSASTISRMETAQVRVRVLELQALLDVYGVTGTHREELLQIARERRQRPWWQEYRELPNLPLAAREADAASILQYSALLMPGLLQTKAYAGAVLGAIRLDAKAGDIERRLELRMDRQALLTSEDPPEYWAVLDEAVLRRAVGGRTIMHEQLQRLIDATELPNVTLQVLAFESGAHAGMDGEFTILRYLDPDDPDVVYIENTGGDMYVEKTDVTRRYNVIFDHLRATARNPGDSIRTLRDLQSELYEPEGS
jgi:transcriptional regulator with XRE-family HTH domain